MTLTTTEDALFEFSTDWAGYQKILELTADRRMYVTYDRGRLELLTPGWAHEQAKTLLGALLECLMTELEIDFLGAGALTIQRQDLDRGFEPDECYWITHWETMRGKKEWVPREDPPPDLAIEVEVTSRIIDRLSLYHAVGIGEVWRLTRDRRLIFLQHFPDGYSEVATSPNFPWLAPDHLSRWLSEDLSQGQLIRAFRAALPRP